MKLKVVVSIKKYKEINLLPKLCLNATSFNLIYRNNIKIIEKASEKKLAKCMDECQYDSIVLKFLS